MNSVDATPTICQQLFNLVNNVPIYFKGSKINAEMIGHLSLSVIVSLHRKLIIQDLTPMLILFHVIILEIASEE